MEKKESTTFSPFDMCEKLFNAFKPIFRPLRRLTFNHQEPGGTTNPSSTRPINRAPDSGTKDPGPQKELPTSVKPMLPTPQKKPAETIAPKAEPHHPLPKPAATPAEAIIPPKAEPHRPLPKPAATPPPPPPSESVSVRKVPDKVVPIPAPPRPVAILQPTAPRAVPTPQPPPGAAAEPAATSKKNFNERVEDYIKTAKAKISRTGSGVGS